MTKKEFYELVNGFDWFYNYSDDHRVWCAGRDVSASIGRAMQDNPEFREIYKEFADYYNRVRETRPTLEEFNYEV